LLPRFQRHQAVCAVIPSYTKPIVFESQALLFYSCCPRAIKFC
jgi:hypothetical protein